MTCARTLALWLVATIVLIAAGLVPSGAEAHAGHAHTGPGRTVAASPALPASFAAATKSVVVTTVRASAESGLARPCDGACCRTSGTSCCTGTALAADLQAVMPPRARAERALPRALPARTDVVPEALPEPPRSFA
jgi:hypothetical protein